MENVSYAILVIFIFYFDFSLQDIRVKRQTTNITKCSFDLEVSQSGKLQGDTEINTCDWNTDVSNLKVFPWKFGTGRDSSWRGGPEVDAEGDRNTGGFVFMDLSLIYDEPRDQYQEKGWVITPLHGDTDVDGRCLKFFYSMDGLNVESLRVIQVDVDTDGISDMIDHSNDTKDSEMQPVFTKQIETSLGFDSGAVKAKVVWSRIGTTNGKWMEGHLSYTATREHFFILEANPNGNIENNYRGYVAVDEFSISDGVCSSDCNFDADILTGYCNWVNDQTGDNFDWSVSRGSLKSWTGPTRDQSKRGGYAYIDTSYPRRPGDRARMAMKTPLNTTSDGGHPQCLSFYFNMFGSDLGTLSVLLQSSSDDTEVTRVWHIERPVSSPRDTWHRAQVTLASSYEVNVIIEATVGDTDRGDIAVDTVRLDTGACVIMPGEAATDQYSGCSFNIDKCGYQSQNVPAVSSSTYSTDMWTRVRGGSGRFPRGHRTHVTDEDWYMSFDTYYYGYRPLDRGYLLGPQIPVGGSPMCVGFWVYMSTNVASVPYLGRLRLLLIPRNVTGQVDRASEPKVLWSLTNQQEASWFYAQASFDPKVPYLLVFEGLRANSVLGAMAVDDITIFEGQCSTLPSKVRVDPRDCSFEFDMCGWRAMNPGQNSDLLPQDWRLSDRNHKLASIVDHTYNLESRGYVYFETNNIQTKTWLISPTIDSNVNLCLQFWFAPSSKSASNLLVKRQFENGTMSEVWRQEIVSKGQDNNRDQWEPAQVPLPALTSESHVFIEGNSDSGGFAIDDIKITTLTNTEECEKRPSTTAKYTTNKTNNIFKMFQ